MSAFPGSPRTIRGGIVLLDPASSAVRRVIGLQYNPESVTRTLQAQATGEGGTRSEALRLKGPPIETLRLDAEIDATDQLEFPDQNQPAVRHGIHPQLAALEMIVYPTSAQLQANDDLAQAGTLEILPMESSLALFVWSPSRVVPVRSTDFSFTEEAFDTELNPIRAKVSLGLRVLSVDDLGFRHRGGSLFMAHQRHKERLAGMSPAATLGTLGLRGIP
jgi:hypothetical protein